MSATAPQTKQIKVPDHLSREAVLSIEGEGESKSAKISISSDTPYLRYDWWNDEEYYEVLDHSPSGFNDSRLKAGLPMLFNHKRDEHLGRAKSFECDGKRITVSDLIWGESAIAKEKRADYDAGILVDTSVGYSLLGDGECVGAKDGIPIYRFKWEPHEFSLVTIPADITVGAGRNRGHKPEGDPRVIAINLQKGIDEPPKKAHTAPTVMAEPTAPEKPPVDLNKERETAIAEFKARCKKIDDFVSALKNAAWQKAAAVIATKHKEGEANFEDFRTEANNAFTSETHLDDTRDENGIVIVGDRPQRQLSIGAQFVKSKEFSEKAKMTGKRRSISMDADISLIGIRGKVALAARAGFVSSDLAAVNIAPQSQLVALGVQRLTIMDLIAPGTTSAAAIPYPRENSFTGAATTVGERGVKPNWDPDLTTETANVRKVAVTTKVPDEFLADFPDMQSYLDERMPYQVDIETERQVLYGDGLDNNLKGITSAPGIQTRAYATAWGDTIYKALTDIRVNAHFEPDGIAMHPYDWEVARLEKDLNGQYLAGGPYYIPYGNGVFMEMNTFWGKPVVITTSVAVTKPIVGCWKLGAQYFIREGMRLETTNANEDDFKRNLVAIRAEHRLALAVYRPVSFLEVTGGPARS